MFKQILKNLAFPCQGSLQYSQQIRNAFHPMAGAGPQWEVLAVNDLGEECQATPAIGGKSIYIRSAKALYSFTEKR